MKEGIVKSVEDWYKNGPPCLNCGERVPECEKILGKDGIVFRGMCKSDKCKELPPGGNPFMFILSRSEEEE